MEERKERTLHVRGADFETYLPHRGRNLIIDAIDVYGEGDEREGFSSVSIAPDDAAGRDIFLQTGRAGGPVYSTFGMMEHVALTSSVMIFREIPEGKVAFFSAINNYRRDPAFEQPAPGPLRALVVPRRGRGPFHRSHCNVLAHDDRHCMTVDIMAAVLPAGAGGGDETGKTVDPPTVREVRPVDRSLFSFRHEAFAFVDEEVALDAAAGGLTARFAYPADHPFTAGHFPGNPVMMGVAQWSAMLDASLWAATRLDLGAGAFRASGDIMRPDGSVVCEVKDLVFQWDGPGTTPCITATKRVSFRGVVNGGDTIYIQTSVEKEDR